MPPLPLCLLIPHLYSCPSAGPEKLQHSITTYMSSAPSPSQVSVYTLRNKGGGERAPASHLQPSTALQHALPFSSPAATALPPCPPLYCPSPAASTVLPPLPACPGLFFHHTQPKSLLPFAATSSHSVSALVPSSLSFLLSFLFTPAVLCCVRDSC